MKKKNKGCYGCRYLEYFYDDSSDGFPGPNEGWGCNFLDEEDIKRFKSFPAKRKPKCFEPEAPEYCVLITEKEKCCTHTGKYCPVNCTYNYRKMNNVY